MTDSKLASLLASAVSIAVDVATIGLASCVCHANTGVDIFDEALFALLAIPTCVMRSALANTARLDALMTTDRIAEAVRQADVALLVK